MNPQVIAQLISMRHSPIKNYIVPGLISWLIMDQGGAGKVRMFENTREQHAFITPHSHRFNFSACVVRGWVENTSWFRGDTGDDMYRCTGMKYDGEPGKYVIDNHYHAPFISDPITHEEGAWYAMKHSEIHSIKFSKGAMVLFFEGPAVTDTSYTLEPVVDHEYLPTMKTEPWMFKRGEK